MSDSKKIPAKGEYNQEALYKRSQFLQSFSGEEVKEVSKTFLDQEKLKGNIESCIGSVEIPVGIAGPLRINGTNWEEDIIAPLGTTEGALVSSVSRGAKLLNLSGGVRARFVKQVMTRVPCFVFKNIDQATKFSEWVEDQLEEIKTWVKDFSNYSILKNIKIESFAKIVHLRMFYETGDAAGQNMVTICSKGICEKIINKLKEIDLIPEQFLVDGNGSADKKTAFGNIVNGRGSQVSVEAYIKEAELNRVMKVDSNSLVKSFYRCQTSNIYGLPSTLNVNIANVLAAIFAPTGQDLACVGESAQGQLYLEKTDEGLYASMHLSNLVIGTVGGGTKLPAQKEMLRMMGCYGEGKVPRFAEIIASFCLALDLSTFSALVAGHFTQAHQRLGR